MRECDDDMRMGGSEQTGTQRNRPKKANTWIFATRTGEIQKSKYVEVATRTGGNEEQQWCCFGHVRADLSIMK
jgi:hypothetical protein